MTITVTKTRAAMLAVVALLIIVAAVLVYRQTHQSLPTKTTNQICNVNGCYESGGYGG